MGNVVYGQNADRLCRSLLSAAIITLRRAATGHGPMASEVSAAHREISESILLIST